MGRGVPSTGSRQPASHLRERRSRLSYGRRYAAAAFVLLAALALASAADAAVPGSPTGVTATAASTTSLTVSWTAPDVGTNPAVNDYDVRYYAGSADPSNAADWIEEGETNGPPNPGTSTTVTITGLTAATAYRVQVRAANSDGEGAWSASLQVFGCSGSTAVGGSSVGSGGLVNDCEALLASEAALVGTGTALNWDTGTAMTSWSHVVLASSRVTELNLWEKSLAGSIPARLGDLSSLIKLYLDGNTLTGSIPSALGNLSSLTRLYLNGNSLTGSIPAELDSLSSLERLYLHGNGLTGSIPAQLGNLSSLEHLLLSSNSLTGSIPSALGNLSSLTALYLDGNSLNGSIPAALGNLSSLEDLRLYSNSLSDPIPAALGNLSSLQVLLLNGNSLNGSIPPELGNLSSLAFLWMQSNSLTGSIPSELGNLSSLTNLRVDLNTLTGCIPAELWPPPAGGYLWVNPQQKPGSGQVLNLPVCPGRPILALVPGTGEVKASWTVPVGGTPTGYDVEYKLSSDSDWIDAEHAGTDTATDIGSLTNNSAYSVRVRATTATDTGPWSAVATTTPAATPTATPPDFGTATVVDQRFVMACTGTGAMRTCQSITAVVLPQATGGNGTLTYMLSPSPSTGLSFDPATRTLSGAPSAGHAATAYTFSATDADGNADWLTFTMAVSFGCAGSTAVGGIASGGLVDDCEAMLASETVLVGAGTPILDWDTSLPMTAWTPGTTEPDGVSRVMLTGGRVTSLLPYSKTLSGTIPAALGNLASLTQLWLYDNQLTGPIPAELGRLSSLTELLLNRNDLTGCIPAALSKFRGTINPQRNGVNLPVCPGMPELTASAGVGSITASWTVPEGEAPTGYDLAYRLSSAVGWTDAGHAGTGTTASIGSLRHGSEYQMRVRAKTATATAEGVGDWSTVAVATPRPPPPSGGGDGGGGGAANRPPTLTGPASEDTARTVRARGTAEIDLSARFSDPDGDRLSYSVESSDPAVAVASVEGDVLTVRGVGRGTAEITVTATDPDGQTATQTFTLTVQGPEAAWYLPPASDPLLQGFVRVVNRSGRAGAVAVTATDDAGTQYEPLTLSMAAHAAVHFNSRDLEDGNPAKGLTGATGPGTGAWRLEFESDALDVEALAHLRTADGFVTGMGATAPKGDDGLLRLATFNPASNTSQVSRLRLVNPTDGDAEATVTGVDDAGNLPGEPVVLTLGAGTACEVDASALESGRGLACGAPQAGLGDGKGKWRLAIESDAPLVAMGLLSSPTGHLANLSGAAAADAGGTWHVPLFPPASDPEGRQGFVRAVSRSDRDGMVTIRAFDDTGFDHEPLALRLGAGKAVQFNADDLEVGNPGKGLTGSTGPGTGAWRLELSSADVDFEAHAYVRHRDGFLTAMQAAAPSMPAGAPAAGRVHRVATLNPGSNPRQLGVLRLVNRGAGDAAATVTGADDRGVRPGGPVAVRVPAGVAVELTAAELEAGESEAIASGALGDGAGKWRLRVASEGNLAVMGLLRSPMGHLSNLSRSGRAFEALPSLLPPPEWVTAEPAGHRRVRSEWAEVPGARYGVELLLGGAPVEGRSLAATTRTDFRWSGLEPGAYSVRVRSVDADGAAGPWGEPSNEVAVD